MSRTFRPIPFAGAELTEARHVCAFFDSEDEEYRVLLPFIRDGFDAGEKALHVVSGERRPRHLGHLWAAGIDAAAAEGSGQLEIRLNTETYLSDGRFDPDRMFETFRDVARETAAGPYRLNRVVCQMGWASRHPEVLPGLLEFESRINEVWCQHDDAVICAYPLGDFGADMVMDIMRTHPRMIVGGTLQRNPYYVPPPVFLEEMRRRRSGPPDRLPG